MPQKKPLRVSVRFPGPGIPRGAGIREKGAVRHIAFSMDDVDGIIEKVRKAGYEVFIEPNDIVISSSPALHARMAFCKGALGEEIEFFQ